MKVRFVPQDVEFEISPDETVFDVAIKNGIYIKTVCNGVPSCADCTRSSCRGSSGPKWPMLKVGPSKSEFICCS